ncbi:MULTISPECIES: cell division protein FtsL [Providencia]|uniref:Cell division protein FtsL n=1 Tax=Providencia heimbachae ATCC 35613 TaxID=1354272 RepID=A0A1B7JKD8_9GAMM|nr:MULTISPECIES: cell division protein FtsL [Providencia]MBP6121765.1 cell division protein FtsL [Providencia sp.]MDD9341615.1 cell division protein FtsL [Providencia heimbachae]NIH21991.1 cell division protein FtsL [Providencia heimbachae]OAT48378.1 FtsL family cell division protein [Providencia heimbachae ATCC 35613]QCJ69474.1 cell division protein FtsL [Providencia heimbachae]
MIPERHSLAKVIGRDLFRYGIIPLILLGAITISAIFVVTTAHETRLLTAAKDKLYEEKDSLDIEWRNLILEENALASHSRVERLSVEKLQMVHVEPSQENIIVSKQ